MDAAVATEPVPKKRGRPRKVINEDAPVAEPKKTVRKASTKATVTEKKEEAPKKAAKTTKTATKSTATKTSKTTKATKAIPASKTPSTSKTAATAAAKAASAPKVEEKIVETPKIDEKPTPVTPSTSKILEKVFKTGTVKPPAQEPAAQEIVLPTGGAANVVIEQPVPVASNPSISSETAQQTPTAVPSSAPQPTPTPTYIPPTSPTSAASPPSPPPPSSIRPPIPRLVYSVPKPSSKTTSPPPLRKATTIPLPIHPINPSKPATRRPKPLSAEEAQKAATERYINEGRMPPQYKAAARRVTSIMVGIPVILVVGWDLYKRYDAEIRKKFDAEGKRVES